VRWKKGWSREGDEHLFRFCWGGVCIPCWDCRSEEECRTEVVSDCLVQSGWGAVHSADVERSSTRSPLHHILLKCSGSAVVLVLVSPWVMPSMGTCVSCPLVSENDDGLGRVSVSAGSSRNGIRRRRNMART
jgi:hypothetical protein